MPRVGVGVGLGEGVCASVGLKLRDVNRNTSKTVITATTATLIGLIATAAIVMSGEACSPKISRGGSVAAPTLPL